MAVHRPAEFNKSHIPAFLAGEEPDDYICVYPFVRSYEWYLLGEEERRQLLAEHGMMAREYPDVRANTVACFALNDYEWMLAFEADELHRIVDLMRHLRGAQARLHTRVEIPFYTGRRKPVSELLAALLVRLLFGRERFTAELAWQDIGPLLPGWEIVTCPPRLIIEHLDGVDAICPFGAWIDKAVLDAGSFGLVHQFGVGLEKVDVDPGNGARRMGRTGAW